MLPPVLDDPQNTCNESSSENQNPRLCSLAHRIRGLIIALASTVVIRPLHVLTGSMSAMAIFRQQPGLYIKLGASVLSAFEEDNLMQSGVMRPHWLELARRFQALAQNGLAYCRDPYDRERYEEIRRLAAEMMQQGAGLEDFAPILDLFKTEVGYATPKVGVRAAVFDRERILLVRERKDGLWTVPGGWADVGDTPSASAIREVKEESGYDVVVKKLAALYDQDLDKHGHPPMPHHIYTVFFICELCGGAAVDSVETSGVDFFEEGSLPPLSLPRITPVQVKHMFDHHRNPGWPTSFD